MSEAKKSYLDSVYKCIAEVKYKEAAELGKKAIEIGVSPDELASALTKGMTEIGVKYEARKIGLPHLFLAVKCVKEILTPLKGVLKMKEKGVVVLGTAKNDVHNIGKNLVAAMLDLYGYKVVDIGEDVDADKFVSAAKEANAHIVGVSALLAMTADYSKVVVEAFKKAGIRDRVKIIAGGAPVTPDLAKRCGVDGYARDAVGAVKLVDALMKGEKIESDDAVVF